MAQQILRFFFLMEWNFFFYSGDSVHTFQFLWLTLLMFVNVMRVKPVFVSSASSNNPSSEVEWFIIPSCLKSEAVLDTDYWLFRSPGTGWGWDYSDCSDHSKDLRAQIWQLCWYSVLTPDANTSQPQPALIISPARLLTWPDYFYNHCLRSRPIYPKVVRSLVS